MVVTWLFVSCWVSHGESSCAATVSCETSGSGLEEEDGVKRRREMSERREAHMSLKWCQAVDAPDRRVSEIVFSSIQNLS